MHPMRILYLHGFCSGPRSAKAVAMAPILERAGDLFEAPDLNLPSFQRLRIAEQVRHVTTLLAGGEPTVLIGSSLGALVALHAQARSDEVKAVVLLAPALEADVRWAGLVGGEQGIAAWRAGGKRRFHHFAYGRECELDVGFLDDLIAHALPPALRVPAEVVQGLRDATVPPEVARRFVEREPDLARLTLVDDDHGLLSSLDEVMAALDRARRRATISRRASA